MFQKCNISLQCRKMGRRIYWSCVSWGRKCKDKLILAKLSETYLVTQTSNKKGFVCISRGKKLWRLYDETSVKAKSNPGMPSQIKEHFTSVFSKACECAGEGIGVSASEMRLWSWKLPSLRRIRSSLVWRQRL